MAKRGPRAAVIGDNEMTDDERYHLTNEHRKKYEVLLQEKKIAAERLADFARNIKDDLGTTGLADIKDLIALSTPEGEEMIKAEMERKARVLRWMNIPIGSQGALFDEPDRRPITERAFADGRRAGVAGEPHKNPYFQGHLGHSAWNDGFAQGQEALATGGFKKIDETNASSEWQRQTREQNERVDRAIKSDAIDSLTQN